MTPSSPEPSDKLVVAVPGRRIGDDAAIVTATQDGIQLKDPAWVREHYAPSDRFGKLAPIDPPDLVQALLVRALANGMTTRFTGRTLPPAHQARVIDHMASKVLVVRRSERWREAVSTALLGDWCEPLWSTGQLPATALGALKAESRRLHRKLVPLWEQGTRRGRVLSLDADLGGLSLYDLVATDVDYLAHTAGGVFQDERLNAVLAKLTTAERKAVYAYAEDLGTTWTEAAVVVGAADPEAFGERVRRKVKRLAAEQQRRAVQRRTPPPPTT